jgi:predicted 3-demethylubiquinone-9 3-methyltransferase (glyoxalase superfamily)
VQKIVPCLWFDTESEDAAQFYTSVLPNSRIIEMTRYGSAGPRPEGMVMTVTFELDGQRFRALNGGPEFKPDEAISFDVNCEDQEEVDFFWHALSEGGEEGPWRVVEGQVRRLMAGRADRPAQAARRP